MTIAGRRLRPRRDSLRAGRTQGCRSGDLGPYRTGADRAGRDVAKVEQFKDLIASETLATSFDVKEGAPSSAWRLPRPELNEARSACDYSKLRLE